ncbi:MAG: hypothetical protein MJD61_16155 [Proteobacteria bacterium]|nr:hypothetical protein [Pseudomonadota bacterium]
MNGRTSLRAFAYYLPRLTLSIVILAALLEALLRLFPDSLGPGVANYVRSIYHWHAGGMYFKDPVARINLMHPNHQDVAYWNGYQWDHTTDVWGFRNPPGTRTDGAIILGDSMIYGHGVNLEHTAAYALRESESGSLYNMARQGDSLYQHYVLLRLYQGVFKPQHAVVVVFINDFWDVFSYRTTKQLAELPEVAAYGYRAMRERVNRQQSLASSLAEAVFYRSAMLKALGGLYRSIRDDRRRDDGALLPYLALVMDDEGFAPIGAYYRRILSDLANRLARSHSRLSVVFLHVGEAAPGRGAVQAQDKVDRFLAGLCRATSIGYWSTKKLFAGCRDCFLENDGHFSPQGHRRFADFLRREVLPHKAPAR